MWKKYNQTLNTLKDEEIQITNDGSVASSLVWKAYNLTLIENSKNFLHMITYNESNLEQDLQKDMNETLQIFASNNFNRTLIYNTFVMQFSENFNQNIDKSQQNFLNKNYKKLVNNLMRFKQRYIYISLEKKLIL